MAFGNEITAIPKVIAELGPGDSLGIGLAGLISGADKYYALDVLRYAKLDTNIKIFEELVELFRERQNIPDEEEFPRVKPLLKSYKFPRHILNEKHLNSCLKPDRIRIIKDSIINYPNKKSNNKIRYFVPWSETEIIEKESVDMIYSQAVMEHVENLGDTYRSLYLWLKPGGFMSHRIDYKSHGTAKDWNGHWAYPNFIWKLIKGKKPYLLNRLPHSSQINAQKKMGFQIISEIHTKNYEGIKRQQLSPRFSNISEEDLVTSGAYILSLKK